MDKTKLAYHQRYQQLRGSSDVDAYLHGRQGACQILASCSLWLSNRQRNGFQPGAKKYLILRTANDGEPAAVRDVARLCEFQLFKIEFCK
jgi:hypothetical protein